MQVEEQVDSRRQEHYEHLKAGVIHFTNEILDFEIKIDSLQNEIDSIKEAGRTRGIKARERALNKWLWEQQKIAEKRKRFKNRIERMENEENFEPFPM